MLFSNKKQNCNNLLTIYMSECKKKPKEECIKIPTCFFTRGKRETILSYKKK